MRRRGNPLLRTAVIGGGAYAMGKKSANAQANEAAQNQQIAELQAQQAQQAAPPPAPAPAAPAPAPAAPAAAEDDTLAQIERLADLHGAGALTDEEYAAAKAKILGL
jgi:hemolysin activation/secretion protein